MADTEFQPINGGDGAGGMEWFTPPSDAPVLFNVQGRSSTIKQRKDGSFKLVINGVEQVHWQISDALVEGHYSPIDYASSFDSYYHTHLGVKSYQSFSVEDGIIEKFKFKIFNAKYKRKSGRLVYDIEPLNNRQLDYIIGIKN